MNYETILGFHKDLNWVENASNNSVSIKVIQPWDHLYITSAKNWLVGFSNEAIFYTIMGG